MPASDATSFVSFILVLSIVLMALCLVSPQFQHLVVEALKAIVNAVVELIRQVVDKDGKIRVQDPYAGNEQDFELYDRLEEQWNKYGPEATPTIEPQQ